MRYQKTANLIVELADNHPVYAYRLKTEHFAKQDNEDAGHRDIDQRGET